MKAKVGIKSIKFIFIGIALISLTVAGCFYPKAERVGGELVSEVKYEIVDETTVVDDSDNGRQWIYVDCDYWAGCFMRCDGKSAQCKQLAKDSNLSILSVFMSAFK